jgi:hypothetical protein
MISLPQTVVGTSVKLATREEAVCIHIVIKAVVEVV